MADPTQVIEFMDRIVTQPTDPPQPADPRDRFHQLLHQAAQMPPLNAVDLANTKMAAVRTGVARALHPITAQQATFNSTLIAAIGSLDSALEQALERITELESRPRVDASGGDEATRATLAGHELLLDDLTRSTQELSARLDDLSGRIRTVSTGLGTRIAKLTTQLESEIEEFAADRPAIGARLGEMAAAVQRINDHLVTLQGDVGQTRARLNSTIGALARADDGEPAEGSDAGGLHTRTLAEVEEMRRSDLYAAFEDRFRGSREAIIATLSDYESDIDRLASRGPVLDLGPGRGEWLEVLRGRGVKAYGVDTNPTFVEQGRARGLDVRLGDAITHLAEVPASSVGAVTAFHLVEHLPLDVLTELLERAFVAMAPGGRLLLETPNPSNLIVGASNFYLDPTHLRPLHPDLLQFLVESAGFVEVEIRHLHPLRELEHRPSIDDPELADLIDYVRWSMFGPQDYAVLATRPGGPPLDHDGRDDRSRDQDAPSGEPGDDERDSGS